jgi:hypothetical protein
MHNLLRKQHLLDGLITVMLEELGQERHAVYPFLQTQAKRRGNLTAFQS